MSRPETTIRGSWRHAIVRIHVHEFRTRLGMLATWAVLGPIWLFLFQAETTRVLLDRYLPGSRWAIAGSVGVFAAMLVADVLSRDEQTGFGDHLAVAPVPVGRVLLAKASFVALTIGVYLAWILSIDRAAVELGIEWATPLDLIPSPDAVFCALLGVVFAGWLASLTRQPLMSWFGAVVLTCPMWTMGALFPGAWYAPVLEVTLHPVVASSVLGTFVLGGAIAFRTGTVRVGGWSRMVGSVALVLVLASIATAHAHHRLFRDVVRADEDVSYSFVGAPDGQRIVVFQRTGRWWKHRHVALQHEADLRTLVVDLETGSRIDLGLGLVPVSDSLGTWRAPAFNAEGELLLFDDEGILHRARLEDGWVRPARPGRARGDVTGASMRDQVLEELDTWFQIHLGPSGTRVDRKGGGSPHATGWNSAPTATPGVVLSIEDGSLHRVDLDSGEKVVYLDQLAGNARPLMSPDLRFVHVRQLLGGVILDALTGQVICDDSRAGFLLEWSNVEGRLAILINGWVDASGTIHVVPLFENGGRVHAEVGDEWLLVETSASGTRVFALFSTSGRAVYPLDPHLWR